MAAALVEVDDGEDGALPEGDVNVGEGEAVEFGPEKEGDSKVLAEDVKVFEDVEDAEDVGGVVVCVVVMIDVAVEGGLGWAVTVSVSMGSASEYRM